MKFFIGLCINAYPKRTSTILQAIGLLIFILGFTDSYGQTRSHLNHYLFNYYLVNPAVAGIEDYVDIKTSIRSQWSGLEGAPETLGLTINANIENGTKINPANPQKPSGPEIEGYTVDLDGYNARPHHGVGMIVLGDRVGPFSKLRVNGTYAYHIPLSKKYRLSAGLSAGVITNRLDPDKITLHDPNDIAVSGENYTNINPDIGFGLWFYSRSLFVGFSGNQLMKYNNVFGDYIIDEKESYRVFNLNAGYRFFVNPNVIITPSLLFRFYDPQPTTVDYNLVMSFVNRVSLGLTYRNSNEFVMMCRFIASPVVEFGYAFDFGTASVDRYNYGGHELYVGLRLKNTYKILCPVNL